MSQKRVKMQEVTFLNGKYLPLEQASISVLDRGFLFGDGVYEVIPVYQGVSIGLELHLNRLFKSLEQVQINLNYTIDDLINIVQELIAFNPDYDQSIYIQITRGCDAKRKHEIDRQTLPTVFIMSSEKADTAFSNLIQGKKAITVADNRWNNCNIKATSLLPNVLLLNQATRVGADEALLIRDGKLVEGSRSNVFLVKNGTIITPPLNKTVLAGITREVVIAIAKQHEINFVERNISYEELHNADEIWISSSTKEIMPIVELDKKSISNGQAGPVWQKIIKLYKQYISNVVENTKAKAIIS